MYSYLIKHFLKAPNLTENGTNYVLIYGIFYTPQFALFATSLSKNMVATVFPETTETVL